MAPIKFSQSNYTSPQERRSLLKNTEQVKGVMPIETYLERLEPYRSTTLSWPYPHNILPAEPTTTKQIEHHRSAILAILEAHSFPPPQYLRLSIHSATKQLYHSKPIPVLSLTYITDPDSTNAPAIPETLGPARNGITTLLRENGINDVHTEIVFVNQVFEPTCLPMRDDDPAAEAFEAAKRNINRVVSRLRDKWSMVKMFNVGVTAETALPTVVVQVNPRTEADWDAMAREILSYIPTIDEYNDGDTDMDMDMVRKIEIGVEFMTGKIVKPIVYPEEEEELADAFGNFSEVLEEGLVDGGDYKVIRDDVGVIVDRFVELELSEKRKAWFLERIGEVKKRRLE